MGGHALKTIKTRRYSVEEFCDIKNELRLKLQNKFICFFPFQFEDKKDFGDIDIIIKNYNRLDIRGFIQEEFSPNEIIKNDDVYSFNYGLEKKDFQVDIIDATNYFEEACFYFSWSDFGNLIGRIAFSVGCKLGHKLGLCVKYELKTDYYLPELNLSSYSGSILTFLGLDYQTFKKGFKTQKDIFDYTISSKFFNGKLYKFENLNNENRTRNKKRPFYIDFVKYLEETRNIEINKTGLDIFELSNIERKNLQLSHVKHFGKLSKLEDLLSLEKIKTIQRARFNGNIILSQTGINKNLLGNFINRFKEKYPELNVCLLDDDFDINGLIRKFYSEEFTANERL